MSRPVRIGNAHGFWGDRLDAAKVMLAAEPGLDFLTLDFLAEVSMSVLALERSARPGAGWPRDFVEIVRSIAPYWRSGGRCRVITNAGGLNPMGCARACLEVLEVAGCAGRTIAVVAGDDVLDLLRTEKADNELLRNLDTGESIASVRSRLVTANAYLGARPVAEALAGGTDLVDHRPRGRSESDRGSVRACLRLVVGRLGPPCRGDRCWAPDRVRHSSDRRDCDRLARHARRRRDRISDRGSR